MAACWEAIILPFIQFIVLLCLVGSCLALWCPRRRRESWLLCFTLVCTMGAVCRRLFILFLLVSLVGYVLWLWLCLDIFLFTLIITFFINKNLLWNHRTTSQTKYISYRNVLLEFPYLDGHVIVYHSATFKYLDTLFSSAREVNPFSPADQTRHLCKQCRSRWDGS